MITTPKSTHWIALCALALAAAACGDDGGGTGSAADSQPVASNSDPDSGIDGGISTGNPIRLRVAFKPTSSIGIKGRHDPCVAIRGAPVVEAMVALVLADHKLLHRGQCSQ